MSDYGREEALADLAVVSCGGCGVGSSPCGEFDTCSPRESHDRLAAYIDRLTTPEDTTDEAVEEALRQLRDHFMLPSVSQRSIDILETTITSLRSEVAAKSEREALLERLQREVVAVFDDAPELRDDFRVRGVVQVLDALSLLSPTAPTQARKEVE